MYMKPVITDMLLAIITKLATRYQQQVRAKGSQPSMKMLLDLPELEGLRGSPIQRFIDELRQAEAAKKGKNREINEPMAWQEPTPGQY